MMPKIAIIYHIWFLCSLTLAERGHERCLAIKQGVTNFSNPIASGVRTFKELVRKSKFFVDNSNLIAHVIEEGYNALFGDNTESWIWIAPNQFGKTMNLDMIKTFFQIQVDATGKPVPIKTSENFKLFAKGEITLEYGGIEKLQHPLLISKNRTIMNTHFGKYPVIHADFRDTASTDLKEVLAAIQATLSKTYKEHEYLIPHLKQLCDESPRDNWCIDLHKFNLYLHGKEAKVEEAIPVLSEILHKFFKQQVVVLLDDYDVSVRCTMESLSIKLDDVFTMMQSLIFVLFEDSRHVALLISAAKYQLEEREFYRRQITVEKSQPTHYFFGFSDDLVDEMFRKVKIDKKLCKQAQTWYDGYRCENELNNDRFYNPASISRFLTEKKIDVYFKAEANQIFIQQAIANDEIIQQLFLKLLNKGSVEIEPKTSGETKFLFYNAMTLLYSPERNLWWDQRYLLNAIFFHIVYKEGFLYKLPNPTKYSKVPDNDHGKIPNSETATIIGEWMITFYKNKYNITEQLLHNAATALLNFVSDKVASIEPLETSLTSLYQSTVNWTSSNYHLSILNCVTLRLQSETKRELDAFYNVTGRANVVIENILTEEATLIELKVNSTAADALKSAKNYNDLNGTYEVKYLGINVSPDRTVQIATKTT